MTSAGVTLAALRGNRNAPVRIAVAPRRALALVVSDDLEDTMRTIAFL